MFHVKHFRKRKSPRWGLLGEGFLFHEGGGAGVLGRGGVLLTDDAKHPGIPAGEGIATDGLYPAAQLGDGALGRGKLLFPGSALQRQEQAADLDQGQAVFRQSVQIGDGPRRGNIALLPVGLILPGILGSGVEGRGWGLQHLRKLR